MLTHACEWNRLVSSAKSIGFIISETCSMSFIYKMKNNGPDNDPGELRKKCLYNILF